MEIFLKEEYKDMAYEMLLELLAQGVSIFE